MRTPLMEQVAPVVRSGDWVDIGHDSKIRLSGRVLLHRYNGKTTRHGLGWLVKERPLLNWILQSNAVDQSCQPV